MSLLLLATLALAQPRTLSPVQLGEDLEAWRALRAAETPDVEALADFVSTYPGSPLAELARAELQRLGGPDPQLSPIALARLDASLANHEAMLSRRPTQVAVATLSLDEATPAPPAASPWQARAELGLGGGVQGGALWLGAGLHRPAWGVGLRAWLSPELVEGLGYAQLHPFTSGHLLPYAELSAGLRPVASPSGGPAPLLGAALGTRAPLTARLSLDAAAELRLGGEAAPTPRVRMGLTATF